MPVGIARNTALTGWRGIVPPLAHAGLLLLCLHVLPSSFESDELRYLWEGTDTSPAGRFHRGVLGLRVAAVAFCMVAALLSLAGGRLFRVFLPLALVFLGVTLLITPSMLEFAVPTWRTELTYWSKGWTRYQIGVGMGVAKVYFLTTMGVGLALWGIALRWSGPEFLGGSRGGMPDVPQEH